jgi:hypothetical protein
MNATDSEQENNSKSVAAQFPNSRQHVAKIDLVDNTFSL